ncbi:protein of unknown function [Peptoniphilus asaccharolyticus DSM 20463]|uniref:Mobile element protein CD1107-like domain-containing protein n=1 Tax=Peptoniphilus asaccharolyticus DSM 20463 TaxID=573058 RepID=A0A1W1UKQ9_PEPAS|nr:DUF4366 domain-containing protein [Peptoniphilus asaccharolyticus]MBL7574832.1 DUF4366 domain-containing protein [Peptoniphilus asaccharolyticus]SMB81381.1 protein of unknown function [Peptoniphilus asaccharolyticus DSM 20463]
MKKKRLGVALVLLLLLLSMPSISIAKSNENEIKNHSNDIYLPEKSKELESLFDEDVYKPSNESQKIPYQEVPKIQENNIKNEQVDKKEKPSKLVKGGNTKAINPLATKENKARGTVIENVDKNGQDITPSGDTEKDKENPVDVRQFLTFQTKSGKTMHLIVDHSENQENVQLLTEVGEQDLLNMIEGESEAKPKEEVVKKEEPVEEKPKKEEKEEKKSGIGLYLFMGLIIVGVMGAGYYFKIYKKNEEASFEDEQDYNELEDDYEFEGEDYNLEDKEDTEVIPDEDEF